MFALRFRLATVIALALVGGAVSQSAGAGSAAARPLPPGSNSAAIAALSQWAGASRAPVLGGVAAQSVGVRSAAVHSLAAPLTFTDIGANFGSDEIFSASWADYDSDGRLDVLTFGYSVSESSYNTRLYHSNGDGTFSENTNAGLPDVLGTASWGDYNSDGRPDVLIAGVDWNSFAVVSKLYRNNGDGTFSEETRAVLPGLFAFGALEGAITWADYDNDGRSDILFSGISFLSLDSVSANLAAAPTIGAKLYHNNGDGTFSENTSAGLPEFFTSLAAWSDYDGDGYVDVLLNGCADAKCSAGATRLYHNNGDGTFSENTSAGLSVSEAAWMAWADYDGDSRPDLLLSSTGTVTAGTTNGLSASAVDPRTAYTKLYHNNGDGTFSENTAAGLPAMSDVQALWGDYDSDGLLDILFNGCVGICARDVSTHDTSVLFRNNGDGTFSESTGTGLPDAFAWFAWGDYNGDGRLDLLAYDVAPLWNAIVYRNDSTNAGVPPSPPGDFAAHRTAKREITFSWNGSNSKIVDENVGYNLRVGTTPGGSDILSPLSTASGSRLLPQFGNAEGRTFAKLKNLRDGTYYWSVQAIGANYSGSAFGEESTFTIPGKISLELSRGGIYTCGRAPRSITVSGSINPAFEPAHLVVLKRRFTPHAGWKRFATAATNSSGTFRVRNVGKAATRSFWIRAVVDHKGVNRMISPSKYLKVRNVASCEAKEKK